MYHGALLLNSQDAVDKMLAMDILKGDLNLFFQDIFLP